LISKKSDRVSRLWRPEPLAAALAGAQPDALADPDRLAPLLAAAFDPRLDPKAALDLGVQRHALVVFEDRPGG